MRHQRFVFAFSRILLAKRRATLIQPSTSLDRRLTIRLSPIRSPTQEASTMRKLLRSAALCSVALVAGCGAGDSQPSWEQFQLMTHQEADSGFYVVDGDELIETQDEL